jgi:hypothetical protein
LHQAMARDSSGKLQALVTQYTTQTNAGSRDALLQNILYHWAGVQDVDPASRADTKLYGNAIGDARKLEFMEEYFGKDYLGTWCWGERDPNPHGPASVKLLALYEDIKAGFAARLDAQTQDAPLYQALDLVWKESTQSFEFDVSGIVQELRQDYASDTSAGKADTMAHVQRFARNLKLQGEGGLRSCRRCGLRGRPAVMAWTLPCLPLVLT